MQGGLALLVGNIGGESFLQQYRHTGGEREYGGNVQSSAAYACKHLIT